MAELDKSKDITQVPVEEWPAVKQIIETEDFQKQAALVKRRLHFLARGLREGAQLTWMIERRLSEGIEDQGHEQELETLVQLLSRTVTHNALHQIMSLKGLEVHMPRRKEKPDA